MGLDVYLDLLNAGFACIAVFGYLTYVCDLRMVTVDWFVLIVLYGFVFM